MKCEYCKSIIENGSLYCRFCGAQLFSLQKKEMPVPKPRQLADGRWVGQLMADGIRHSIYGNTQEEYEINARATKAGLIAMRYERPKLALGSVIGRYISANENVLSFSTLRGYRMIREHRFASYVDKCLTDIDWQVMVSEEAALCSAKTLRNAWGLVSASLTAIGEKTPNVHLPKTAKKELPFLNYLEIQAFLEALHGKPCELAALLALHSLRLSELLAIVYSVPNIGNAGFHDFKRLAEMRSLKFFVPCTDCCTTVCGFLLPITTKLLWLSFCDSSADECGDSTLITLRLPSVDFGSKSAVAFDALDSDGGYDAAVFTLVYFDFHAAICALRATG